MEAYDKADTGGVLIDAERPLWLRYEVGEGTPPVIETSAGLDKLTEAERGSLVHRSRSLDELSTTDRAEVVCDGVVHLQTEVLSYTVTVYDGGSVMTCAFVQIHKGTSSWLRTARFTPSSGCREKCGKLHSGPK